MKVPPRSSQDETKRGWKITAINSIFFTPKSATGVMSAFRNTSRNNRQKHAEVLMECILFLDGTPTMKPLDLTIGRNVQEMSQRDLDLEFSAATQYNPRVRMALNHPIPDLS